MCYIFYSDVGAHSIFGATQFPFNEFPPFSFASLLYFFFFSFDGLQQISQAHFVNGILFLLAQMSSAHNLIHSSAGCGRFSLKQTTSKTVAHDLFNKFFVVVVCFPTLQFTFIELIYLSFGFFLFFRFFLMALQFTFIFASLFSSIFLFCMFVLFVLVPKPKERSAFAKIRLNGTAYNRRLNFTILLRMGQTSALKMHNANMYVHV